MSLQLIITLLIVAVAVGYAVYRVVRTLTSKNSCNCGCQGCSQSKKCTSRQQKK